MTDAGPTDRKQIVKTNRRTALVVAGVVAAMVGLSFAAVPAYRAFCQVTGWGGTTQRADAAADAILERAVTIRFDGTTGADLPWRFRPEQISQTLKVGESGLAFYEAENLSDRPVTGRATYNVSPAKAGLYFKKIDCFCFTEQRLAPGEKVSMPVTYFIDPAIARDRNLDDVQTITLSYTFFRWDDEDAPPAESGAE
ncbi:cytochrome c oxidase assembly protein [Amphiplicatus metriothermophilus]|uniref:Cytochrome c oxidase assembly protein CtaG n=1 Tax=Amphiplicatus metriothermophilus TaxID=1519374 RepID=A0A239PIT3_9PROT|nr:cytochrome c oxidase assembly protein [Amphiplicatus metriothermophilus]MBB5517945.1 cytochrome c oxidase assembly protein subunit 11 [Amphiplicatus metriothermophilus]SNT67722.1 cytochrome c oxidase assembly protein subunit 11 [Amphiplicatus metriothermophilus]